MHICDRNLYKISFHIYNLGGSVSTMHGGIIASPTKRVQQQIQELKLQKKLSG